jgi:hypothetical protein
VSALLRSPNVRSPQRHISINTHPTLKICTVRLAQHSLRRFRCPPRLQRPCFLTAPAQQISAPRFHRHCTEAAADIFRKRGAIANETIRARSLSAKRPRRVDSVSFELHHQKEGTKWNT